ncbi:MAG: hypothetical protein LUF85_00460 [Bacteroides sp.]|nr:hypothetical protein [Bacteroides sp.]
MTTRYTYHSLLSISLNHTVIHRLIGCILFLCCAAALQAKIELPAVLGSNMVLQQQSSVRLWGKATPQTKVMVMTSWDGATRETHSDKSGRWLIEVLTPKAGGPYRIVCSDGEELVLENILIGEVWLCSGQSNMEMPVRGFRGQPVDGSHETFEAMAGFSATAYYFGELLQRKLGVPVGLVCASWSASKIETWMSQETLQLAFRALAQSYGIKGFSYCGPVFRSWKPVEGKIELMFDHAEEGLNPENEQVIGFEIAGADSVFVPARAEIVNGSARVRVWHDQITDPIEVRYCFRNYIEGNLRNNAGLPAACFRVHLREE